MLHVCQWQRWLRRRTSGLGDDEDYLDDDGDGDRQTS